MAADNAKDDLPMHAWVRENLKKDGSCGLCGKGLWESENLYVVTTRGNIRANVCPDCKQRHAVKWWKFETRTMKLLGSNAET